MLLKLWGRAGDRGGRWWWWHQALHRQQQCGEPLLSLLVLKEDGPPYSTFPHLTVRLQYLKLLPSGNCVSFVFFSSYTPEIMQCDMASGIVLTHLCSCY